LLGATGWVGVAVVSVFGRALHALDTADVSMPVVRSGQLEGVGENGQARQPEDKGMLTVGGYRVHEPEIHLSTGSNNCRCSSGS
jgi:hypothetical protein